MLPDVSIAKIISTGIGAALRLDMLAVIKAVYKMLIRIIFFMGISLFLRGIGR